MVTSRTVTARGEVETVLVKPGDVLYFPAGMWHKVETVEPGVSINVSLMATNYANAISQAIYHYLYRDPRF
jgi:ribosomal protein L16 Arg81 hydroxylase